MALMLFLNNDILVKFHFVCHCTNMEKMTTP